MESAAPSIWRFLKIVKSIIVTTRDGFFEGFFFVGLGMLFAYYEIIIPKKKALIGFWCSFSLMFVEAFFLKFIGFVRATDMYLFLIPTTFFGFAYDKKAKIPDSPIFLELRRSSSLIFYSHPWITVFVSVGLKHIYAPLAYTPLLFLLTTIVTITASFVVIRLSEHRHFQWLKLLYK